MNSLCLLLVFVFVLSACGNATNDTGSKSDTTSQTSEVKNEEVSQQAEEKLPDLSDEAEALITDLSRMSADCDYVASFTSVIWNYGVSTLEKSWALLCSDAEIDYKSSQSELQKIPMSDFDRYMEAKQRTDNAGVWRLLAVVLLGKTGGNKLYTPTQAEYDKSTSYINSFRTAYKKVKTINSTFMTRLKEVKKNTPAGYEEVIDVIQDLYLTLSSYADFVTKPSGNLLNYSSQVSAYKESVEKSMKLIDLYRP